MRVSLAQIDVIWEDKEKNKEKCINYIKMAADLKSDLILFPEMTLTGFSMNVEGIGEEQEETANWFQKQAKTFNINIGFGYVEKADENKGKNNFYVASGEGGILSKYTKIHPFSFGTETNYYTSGKDISFFKIKDFNIGTFICYDLRFPEIFQAASKKAELITVIANWPESRREHWLTLLKARAIENQCYITAVNRVGEGDGLHYSGDSVVVDPLGNVIAYGRNGESLITADLDIDNVKKIRNSFNLKNDRKETLYITFYEND